MLVKIPFLSENVKTSLSESDHLVVHSVFENGINIQTIDRPVFLGMQDGPSSLCIDPKVIPILRNCIVGDPIIFKNDILSFRKQNLEFDISESELISYKIPKQKIMSYMSEKFVKTVIGYDFMTGLDLNTHELIDDLIDNFGYNDLAYLNYLYGRGRGLTPSGDDFLLGMIAYHQVQAYLSNEFFDQIYKNLKQNKTTSISESYLQDALEGNFTRSIINLFESMQQGRNFVARIYEISTFGHSSGVDMLSGIVMGIIMDREMRSKNE